jgi:hypothetical protein
VLGSGLDDLGRMDDGDGAGAGTGEKGEGPETMPETTGAAPTDASGEIKAEAQSSDPKVEVKPAVAAVRPAPEEAVKPTPVQTLPEKNAEKPDPNTRNPSSEKPKKSSAKNSDEGKNPLKSKTKPDNSSQQTVLGPAA